MRVTRRLAAVVLAFCVIYSISGCNKKDGQASKGNTIMVDGSDTMVNLSQAWAEAYQKSHPDVKMQVSGGGSGVGINSLIAGKVDMANSSRRMEEKEIAKFKETHPGKEPKEHVVGLDALALYVHKDNPIESISIVELAEIYGDGGNINKWAQLGVSNKLCASDDITRVSRQNNSGTYAYFREHVLGK